MAEEINENVNELPTDEDSILTQVKEEIQKSRDYVQSRRQEFRIRHRLYNNQRKQRDKIGDTLIYNIINTQLAIYYTDKMTVGFLHRDMGDIQKAQNIENLAKFDYDEMDMEVLEYFVQWDRQFYGVGVRVLTEWNDKTNTPAPRHHDAMSWLPDPRGSVIAKNFRWSGFEVEYTRGEMTDENGFFNQDLLKERDGSRASQKQADRNAKAEAAGLNPPATLNIDAGNGEGEGSTDRDYDIFDMVDQFTSITGDDGITRKYLVSVSDDLSSLHRVEEITPVTPAEKEDISRVPFPFTLNYYSPKPGDPFGVSVPDLTEDKQRARSVFKNLRKKAEQAKLYPMYIYNRQKILNRRDLDFAFNKFIGVQGDVTDGVIAPINKAPEYQGEVVRSEEILEADAQKSTGTDNVVQGTEPRGDRPLGVEQMIQANASLKYILGSKFNGWGDKRFWRLWYRMYQDNFKTAGKKTIRIQSLFGSRIISLDPKDIRTIKDPNITIKSELELKQQRQIELTQWQTILPMIINDPTKPLASRRFAERRMARLQNVPQEEIAVIFPETPDETRAHMENELLSRNEQVPVDVNGEDHLSHMVIHGQSEFTDAQMAHMAKHRDAYIMSGQKDQIKAIEEARVVKGGASGANNPAAENAQAQATPTPAGVQNIAN